MISATHNNLLRGEVFQMWKEEGVAVRRLQDLISLTVQLRPHAVSLIPLHYILLQ